MPSGQVTIFISRIYIYTYICTYMFRCIHLYMVDITLRPEVHQWGYTLGYVIGRTTNVVPGLCIIREAQFAHTPFPQ